MKQYDKAYVPVNQMATTGIYLIATSRISTSPLVTVSAPIKQEVLEEHKSLVLTTIEELRELWDAAQDSLADDAFGIKNATRTISEYLTSKGVTIP